MPDAPLTAKEQSLIDAAWQTHKAAAPRPVPDQARAGPVVNTRADLLATLTEKEWQTEVINLARHLGWRTYHTADSRRSAAGFPDLVLIHPQRGVLFAELKTVSGRISPMQKIWLEDLRLAGATVYVWRPTDEADVKQVLGWPAVVRLGQS